MTDAQTQPKRIDGYHVHIYYEGDDTRATAARVSEAVAGRFGLELRASSGEPQGPHPIPQFRLKFTAAQFDKIVPWLMLNRDGVDVLIHPLTDNSYDDHTKYAIWLGQPVALRLANMRGQYRPEQLPAA